MSKYQNLFFIELWNMMWKQDVCLSSLQSGLYTYFQIQHQHQFVWREQQTSYPLPQLLSIFGGTVWMKALVIAVTMPGEIKIYHLGAKMVNQAHIFPLLTIKGYLSHCSMIEEPSRDIHASEYYFWKPYVVLLLKIKLSRFGRSMTNKIKPNCFHQFKIFVKTVPYFVPKLRHIKS